MVQYALTGEQMRAATSDAVEFLHLWINTVVGDRLSTDPPTPVTQEMVIAAMRRLAPRLEAAIAGRPIPKQAQRGEPEYLVDQLGVNLYEAAKEAGLLRPNAPWTPFAAALRVVLDQFDGLSAEPNDEANTLIRLSTGAGKSER